MKPQAGCRDCSLDRCLRFDINVQYRQGRTIPVAYALSRVCHKKITPSAENMTEDSIPKRNIHFISTPIDLTAVKSSTTLDPTMNLLKNINFSGWPPYRKQCP